jgi:hypothetical protein
MFQDESQYHYVHLKFGNSNLRNASLDTELLVVVYQVPDYRIDKSGKKCRSHHEKIERKLI